MAARSHASKRVNVDDISSDEYVKETGKYDLVVGYIRRFETNTPQFTQIIPTEITQMIHAFQLCDSWDIDYSDPDLIINGDSICKIDQNALRTAFGTEVVGPKMMYHWRLRIKSTSIRYQKIKGFFLNIGVMPDDKVTKEVGTSWKRSGKRGNGFGFDCGHAQRIRGGGLAFDSEPDYGERFVYPGDIMDITLNLKKKYGALSFMINGVDYGVAFNDIPQNYYVLVVNISTLINNIELEFL